MLPMSGVTKVDTWGSRTAIPEILGVPETGDPMAEYWLGAHASRPAQVETASGTEPLDQLVDEQPQLLGEPSRKAFGDCLPYLLKVLSADQALSLQAHPSREQAEAGFARENAAGIPLDDPTRTYKDDWPKPELMLAMTPFEALCGFRDAARTVELFEALGIPELDRMVAPLRLRHGSAGLAEVFLDALTDSPERRALLDQVVSRAVSHVDEESDFGLFCNTAVTLDEFYPNDPSILAALMMNRFTMQPGEGVFLPAGNLHAYMSGAGIEIMANSDNVLRGGLTPKHMDVDELVAVLDFDASPVELVHAEQVAPGLKRFPTPAPEFALWQVELGGEGRVELPATDTARILLLTDGHLVDESGMELHKGQSALVEAGEQVVLHGDGVAYLASPGVW